jgi:hypothetical protein
LSVIKREEKKELIALKLFLAFFPFASFFAAFLLLPSSFILFFWSSFDLLSAWRFAPSKRPELLLLEDFSDPEEDDMSIV